MLAKLANPIVLFTLLLRKTDEKSSYANLKVPKIALSDKSGNPNSVKIITRV